MNILLLAGLFMGEKIGGKNRATFSLAFDEKVSLAVVVFHEEFCMGSFGPAITRDHGNLYLAWA